MTQALSALLSALLAESVAGDPNALAAEHVANDARLARGDLGTGKAIADALREVELRGPR